MKSSVILICNPVAKKISENKIRKASRFLKSKGFPHDILYTGKKGHAENLARQAVKSLPLLIIAAGGDGTFNEVANGIAGSEVPMAILPLGTTNVLAKELNVPEDVDEALKVAIEGNPKTVYLGRIAPAGQSLPAARYFVLMAGIGFDGEAVFKVNTILKKFSGKGAYIYSGIKTLSGFKPEELFFHIDGKTFSGYTAIIGNAAKYGGHYMITPDARPSDPFFYACIFKGKRRLDFLKYALGIFMGRHLGFKDVEYIRATSIEVNGSAHIQIDGDYFGKSPVIVDIAPDIVRLIY